jgi:hypothetical protein
MQGTTHRLGAALVAGLVVLAGSAPAVHAQILPGSQVRMARPTNGFNFPGVINPNFQLAPGLSISQAAFNNALLGQSFRAFPRSSFAFNPFLNSPASTPGTGFGSPVLSTLGGAGLGAFSGAASLSTNPYGLDSTLSTGGYGGGGYGGGGYGGGGYGYEDPTAGFLRGTSDVIRAQGDYLKNVQQARLLQTSADESRLDYRRRLIEEARYERMSQPTAEDVRQQQLADELNRARHEPPISDIISARSLNELLRHLSNDPARPKGQPVALDDEVLKHINVTGVNPNGASVGLLKDEGKLQWPPSLAGAEFQAPRELLSKTLRNVVQNVKSGESVGTGSLNDLKTDLAQLNNLVSKSELSATDYIEAKSYLDQVAAAVRALGDKDVANYFNHKFNAKNVAELIDDMRTKGYDFAPAAPGDEGAYRALQQALAAYDYSITPQPTVTKTAPTPPTEDKKPESK